MQSGALVTVAEARTTFPAIPGVRFPTVVNTLAVLDNGPAFGATGGTLTRLPPALGKEYRVLVPKPDAAGLDAGGIHTVEMIAPVGTNLPWNLRAGSRTDDLCGLSGSFIPLLRTKAERTAAEDPRPSLEERYGTHEGFVKAVSEATRQMMRDRFLLEEDAARAVEEARKSAILR